MQTKYSNNLLEIAVLYYRLLTPNKKTFRLNVFVNHIRIIFYIFKNELTTKLLHDMPWFLVCWRGYYWSLYFQQSPADRLFPSFTVCVYLIVLSVWILVHFVYRDLFYVQLFEVRGDCSLCWYWWNCWPSFRRSFLNCMYTCVSKITPIHVLISLISKDTSLDCRDMC